MIVSSSTRAARSSHALALYAQEAINDLRERRGESDADILAIANERISYYTDRIDALENNTRFAADYIAKQLEVVELGLERWAAVAELIAPTHSDTCTDIHCTCHNAYHAEIVDSIRAEEEEERRLREIKEEIEERVQRSREREWDRYGDDDL